MRRFWLGIGILVLFLALGIWVTRAMDDVHQQISTLLDRSAALVLEADPTEGLVLAEEAHTLWQSHWHGTAAVADHAPMDEIDGLFAQLDILGRSGRYADFAANCARIATLVAAVGEAHSLSWWNLL